MKLSILYFHVFVLKCNSSSNVIIADIASTIGTALGNTHGSCLPCP